MVVNAVKGVESITQVPDQKYGGIHGEKRADVQVSTMNMQVDGGNIH